jgi:hypothetical protein
VTLTLKTLVEWQQKRSASDAAEPARILERTVA